MNAVSVSDFDQVLVGASGSDSSDHTFDLAIISFGNAPRHGYLISRLGKSAAAMVRAVHDNDVADENALMRFQKRFAAIVIDLPTLEQQIQEHARRSAEMEHRFLRVLVDVSCLSRIHIGAIFAALKNAAQIVPIRLSVGYCLASFAPPPKSINPSNRRVSPVHPTFSGWTTEPNLPVDVIVSLGYEKGKALGAVEYLEPNRRWIFVPNSPEHKFLKAVRNHNRELIASGTDFIIDYEVLRPTETYFSLLSLVVGVRSDARPVLLPFGPKIFFAVSLLVAMQVEEAAVWHVDGNDDTQSVLQQPSSHAILMSCTIQLV